MIKASFEILQPVNGQSFLVRRFGKAAFDAPYHFHPEYELTCILQGTGKRYIGSHMEDFATGDLVLLGPNLPHCWKLEPTQDAQADASAIVVQFNAAFLGNDFFEKNEMKHIKKLFQKSGSGVTFNLATSIVVKQSMLALSKEKNSFKFLY